MAQTTSSWRINRSQSSGDRCPAKLGDRDIPATTSTTIYAAGRALIQRGPGRSTIAGHTTSTILDAAVANDHSSGGVTFSPTARHRPAWQGTSSSSRMNLNYSSAVPDDGSDETIIVSTLAGDGNSD